MITKTFSIHDALNNIRCVLYSGGGSAISRVVVYCHGFAGHKDNRAAIRFAEYMLPKYKGLAVLCFDLPCHGEDVRKKLSLSDCCAYLGAVVRYVKDTLCAEMIDCYATSFGGYLTLKYIAENENPFRRIALRSPAVNMYEVMSEGVMTEEDRARLAKGKEVLTGFDRKIAVCAAFLEELRMADITKLDYQSFSDTILILHGEKDEVVPIAAARTFAEKNQIDFIPFPKTDHRFIDPNKMTEAIQYIETFFEY